MKIFALLNIVGILVSSFAAAAADQPKMDPIFSKAMVRLTKEKTFAQAAFHLLPTPNAMRELKAELGGAIYSGALPNMQFRGGVLRISADGFEVTMKPSATDPLAYMLNGKSWKLDPKADVVTNIKAIEKIISPSVSGFSLIPSAEAAPSLGTVAKVAGGIYTAGLATVGGWCFADWVGRGTYTPYWVVGGVCGVIGAAWPAGVYIVGKEAVSDLMAERLVQRKLVPVKLLCPQENSGALETEWASEGGEEFQKIRLKEVSPEQLAKFDAEMKKQSVDVSQIKREILISKDPQEKWGAQSKAEPFFVDEASKPIFNARTHKKVVLYDETSFNQEAFYSANQHRVQCGQWDKESLAEVKRIYKDNGANMRKNGHPNNEPSEEDLKQSPAE